MIVQFPPKSAHGRTPAVSRAAINASVSSVIELPDSTARRTSAAQCADGMVPRARQLLTVLSAKDSAEATLPVPPKSSMIDATVVIDQGIVRTMRTCQEFANRETTFPVLRGHIKEMIDPPNVIGPRLKALRLALDFKTQVAFAVSIGVEKNTYNPWEKGTRELTFEGAQLIRARHRVPLDYLFYGDSADELPAKITRRLGIAS